MPEVIGVDHIYLAVSELQRSESFYDPVLAFMGFRKQRFSIEDEAHVQYYNRHFGIVLRPARSQLPHDGYAPGLHHLCLRVESETEVREIATFLKNQKIQASEPKYYPEYAEDYFAVFFSDPDGIQLEVTNFREERRQRHDHWCE